MKNETNAKEEYYFNLINQLQEEYNQVVDSLNEVNYSIYCLEELQNVKDEKEVLFPVLNGILIEGKINKINSVKMNVGAGVIVTKSVEEAIDFLKEKQKKLIAGAEEIKTQIDAIIPLIENQSNRD